MTVRTQAQPAFGPVVVLLIGAQTTITEHNGMVLTFEIDKIQPGQYRAIATVRGGAVSEPGIYSKIHEAIRKEAEAVPEGFAHFGEVHYGGMSSGTYPLQEVVEKAPEIADRLMWLVAKSHELDGR